MGSLEQIDFGDKGNETNNFMGTLEAIDFEDNSRSPVNMGYTGSLEPINYEDTSNGNSRIQESHTGYHVDKNVDTSYVEASYMCSRNIGEDFMNYKEKNNGTLSFHDENVSYYVDEKAGSITYVETFSKFSPSHTAQVLTELLWCEM